MSAIFYTAEGKITRKLSAPAGYDFNICLKPDESGWIEGDQYEDNFYVDVQTKTVKDRGARPSDNHDFDLASKTWFDKRSMAEHKRDKWKEIKDARAAAEEGGFVWDGSTFDSDEVSQRRIGDAVTMAGIVPNFTIDWTLADNTVRTLSAADMVNAGKALSRHVQAVFQRGRARRAEIEAATTKQEVNAVVW